MQPQVKKYLRPGGRIATEQLLQWANFQPSETVLELAASFGYSAIALAQRYGVKVVGVEKKPESVRQARDNIRAANLENQIEIIEGDIVHLDAIPGQFDYVLAEAILTMQSPSGKAKILQGVRNRPQSVGFTNLIDLLHKSKNYLLVIKVGADSTAQELALLQLDRLNHSRDIPLLSLS